MVDNTNNSMLTDIIMPPRECPKVDWKIALGMVTAWLLGSTFQISLVRMAKAVIVQIISVSTVTSKTPQSAWRTG